MKNLILALILLLPSFFFAQTLEETAEKFWNAVKNHNDLEIIEKGSVLLDSIKKNNFELDSSIAEIRLYTALSYSKLGDYKKSLQMNLLTQELIKIKLGKEHRYYVICLNNIATNFSNMGNYSMSIKSNLEALSFFEIYSGKEHPDYALSLNNISVNYTHLGDYSKSLEYNFEALKIRAKIKGIYHPSYAQSLNNIAINYSHLGDYSNALEYNFEALKIYEIVYGKEHPDYAQSLNNIASNYKSLGDYNKSLEYNFEALKIREKTIGIHHPNYAQSLNNIAINYSHLGEYSNALTYNIGALKIYEKLLGKEHPDYALSLSNIAFNYKSLGDNNKSLEYNFEALKIRERKLGKEHQDYANSLNNISANYIDMGNYSIALKYNLDALEIYEKVLGKEHPGYVDCLSNVSFNYSKMGDYISCSKYLNESYSAKEFIYLKNKFGLNTSLLESNKENLDYSFFLNASILLIDSNNVGFIYKAWINLNGILSSNTKNLENQIVRSCDNSTIEFMNKLKLLKKQIIKNNELTIQEKKERGINQQQLEEEINTLERLLSKKSKTFTDFNRYFHTRNVTDNLDEHELFIDIARIPYYSFSSNKWTASNQYLVFISDSKDTLVDYIFIEDGIKIEQELFDQYNREVTDQVQKSDLKSANFYNYFWKPIADKIGDAETIYVSLGGVYNNINLNTIYNPETGKYLLEEKDIRIVNSARGFILSKENKKKEYTTNTASLFGFPNFDGNTTVSADTLDLFASARDLNSLWIDSLTRGGMKAKPLIATKTEVENISSTLKSKGWQVTSFLVDNASESNIKKQQSPRILHVATHGYFFEDIPLDTSDNRFLGMDRNRVVQDPMLRSGLLFTGANRSLQGEESKGENGLLSAAEASLLDLRETELVVLSACETGKGEVKNSEGVYGLRKAFSDAGAQNIIMSLWKVDDKVTQEFMTTFYYNWLNDNSTIRVAFNKTQLEIKAKYPQPYYWGAFILVGE